MATKASAATAGSTSVTSLARIRWIRARVMVSPPKLLVADELSLGLAPIVVDEVYRNLAAIRDSGTAILLVEQYVAHALGLADDVVVLAKGAVVHAGPAAELGDIAQYVL